MMMIYSLNIKYSTHACENFHAEYMNKLVCSEQLQILLGQ